MEEQETAWDDLVVLGHYPSLIGAQEHALVILAMGEACWVSQKEGSAEFGLHAEHRAVARIGPELAAYAEEQFTEESNNAKIAAPEAPSFSSGWMVYSIWACAVAAVFYLQAQRGDLEDRFASSSKGMIDAHEWWRPFTSLFLHADFLHLLGNVLSAAFFAPFVSRALGPLRAWLLILACGTLGNILTAWTRYPETYVSIGASTAVFGALGILAGLGFSHSVREPLQGSWMRMAAPVVAGFILLGWLGGGSEGSNTDVMAHAFGFGSGLVCGFATAEIRQFMFQAKPSPKAAIRENLE